MMDPSCAPQRVDLCIYQGDTKVVTVTFNDDQGQPVDTTGWMVRAQIRDMFADDSVALAEFDVNLVNEVATLFLPTQQSSSLPYRKSPFRWDIEVDDGYNVVTFVYGEVEVIGESTRND